MNQPIRKILVLGGGSAGFLSAISVKKRNPQVAVTIIRSPGIGIIGVGESTIQTIPKYLHGYLGLDPAEFQRVVEPTWKLAIRFEWGTRRHFHFSFRPQVDLHYEILPKPMGYYYGEEFEYGELASSLCAHDRIFVRQQDGTPFVSKDWAYHFENEKLVRFLEGSARGLGVEILDETVTEVRQDEAGVSGLLFASGRSAEADLFLDCSGFRALLIGDTLQEPFLGFESSLFCDRAIVGNWQRGADEPIRPYTTAETMDAGWCWRIEHEKQISRGYVYASAFISDERAEQELREKNPSITHTRIVRFLTGRYRRSWVKNVIAIGNASGFVEPLESTALHVHCQDAKAVAESIREGNGALDSSIRYLFNERSRRTWESIRQFLAVHYKFNTRLNTEFWAACRAETDIRGAAPIVEYYQQHGPSNLWQETLIDAHDIFGLDGYYTILLGQEVPYQQKYFPPEDEARIAQQIKDAHKKLAQNAFTSEQALQIVRSPSWRWNPDIFRA